jgi:hypothetical protein
MIERDEYTNSYSGPEVKYRIGHFDIEAVTDEINTAMARYVPPAVPETAQSYILARVGTCFTSPTVCNSNKTYDPEIGFTKELATSGLDTQFATFMSALDKFFDERQLTFNSTSYQLMERMANEFVSSFNVLLNELTRVTDSKTANSVSLLAVLSALVFVMLSCSYIFGIFIVSVNQ